MLYFLNLFVTTTPIQFWSKHDTINCPSDLMSPMILAYSQNQFEMLEIVSQISFKVSCDVGPEEFGPYCVVILRHSCSLVVPHPSGLGLGL